MSEDEREEIIYHGTTKGVGESIVDAQAFEEKETFFAQEKELAEYFADRSYDKRPNDGGAAVVSVTLYESDLKSWKDQGFIERKPFDNDDAPELKNKNQLIFNSGGVERLNKFMFKDTLKVE